MFNQLIFQILTMHVLGTNICIHIHTCIYVYMHKREITMLIHILFVNLCNSLPVSLPDRLIDSQTDKQTDRQTNRQIDKQTDRQTDRPTDRQIDR